MAFTTTTGAAVLTPDEVSALVIQPLIEQSVCTQVSTVLQTNSHQLRIPVVTAYPTAGWTAEGAEIGVADATLDEVLVTPKKLAGLTVITNELAADSATALQLIGDGLVRDLKRKLDSAFFGSTVTNGPSGLGSITSTSVDAGDSWTNLDWAAAAQSAAEERNTTIGAFVCSPATALILASLKVQTCSNKALLGADPTAATSRVVAGVPLYVSPTVAANVVWGIPQPHSIIAIRNDATVVTDSSVYFTSNRVCGASDTTCRLRLPVRSRGRQGRHDPVMMDAPRATMVLCAAVARGRPPLLIR